MSFMLHVVSCHIVTCHTQFTYAVIYCTSAREQFAFIDNTMFNSKHTIQFFLITFVQFAHIQVLHIILQSNACHSTARCVT